MLAGFDSHLPIDSLQNLDLGTQDGLIDNLDIGSLDNLDIGPNGDVSSADINNSGLPPQNQGDNQGGLLKVLFDMDL